MRKIYFLTIAMFITVAANSQVVNHTVQVDAINEVYTTTFEDELVIDVATTASTVASPNVSFENPFQGATFDEAEISFDVYNYGELAVLGSLLAIYDGPENSDLGRMYFTNGSYLGYNATGGFFDANMIDYGIDTDFLGTEAWKNVKLKFTMDGFAVYIDDAMVFNESSTDVTIGTDAEDPFTDYSNVLSFLQNASTLVIGTGSWWSDNSDDDGNFYDAQNSYLKNLTFTATDSEPTSINNPVADSNKEVISEKYFNISGVNMGSDLAPLKPGIYIKRTLYSDGTLETTKIIKNQQ